MLFNFGKGLDLSAAFAEGWFSDLTIICGVNDDETKISCHKVVIASSLERTREELLSGDVQLLRLKHPSNIVQTILKFIYTGSVVVNPMDLAAFADVAEDLGLVGFKRSEDESIDEGQDQSWIKVDPKEMTTALRLKRATVIDEDEDSDAPIAKRPKIITPTKVTKVELPKLITLEDGKVRCLQCQTVSSTKGSAMRHLKLKHQQSSESFSCSVCEKQFSQLMYLKQHLRVAHKLSQKLLKTGQ